MRASLWHYKKDYIKASEIAAKIGSWLALLLMFTGILCLLLKIMSWGIWMLMIGGFIRIISDDYIKKVKGVSELQQKVSEVMIPENRVIAVPITATAGEFMRDFFLKYGYHGYPVIEKDGTVRGMITYWFMRNQIKEGNIHENMLIDEIMLKFDELKPLLITQDDSLSAALSKMIQNSSDRLCVTDKENKLRGLLTIATIRRYANFEKF